ncbi:MAG: CPBP family intramembrane metalloprotease [Actinomycetota bacterium]|nr:CPBP family intramembrane metalloprotease [Actinomycetota bacterium]
MALVLALAGLLVVYNSALSLLGLERRRLYVPVNLTMAAALLLLSRARGLSWEDLGLAGLVPGLTWGGAVALGIVAALALAWLLPAVRPLLADRRLAGVGAGELLYRALVRIPLGTVLLEEVAFRGVLYGLWVQQRPAGWALVGTGLAFGLWHIVPTERTLRINGVRSQRLLLVAVVIMLASLAGMGLGVLRILTGGIVAPFLVHAVANSSAAVAAWAALGARRLRPAPPLGRRGPRPDRRR